jgi:hypothetical protein
MKYVICANPICSAYAGNVDPDSLLGWYSSEHLSIAEGHGRTSPIPHELIFFSVKTADPTYCSKCGAPMVDSLQPISLGSCSGCDRPYERLDVGTSFCSKCGALIEIPECRPMEFNRSERLKSLLYWIVRLQRAGHIS